MCGDGGPVGQRLAGGGGEPFVVVDGSEVGEDGGQEGVCARGIRRQRERPAQPVEDRLEHGHQAGRPQRARQLRQHPLRGLLGGRVGHVTVVELADERKRTRLEPRRLVRGRLRAI